MPFCDIYVSIIASAQFDDEGAEAVRQAISVPQGFRALAEQVNAVLGPGLPVYRSRHQVGVLAGFWG